MREESSGEAVVLVGHCGPDEWMLRATVARALPESPIEVVHDDAGMQAHLAPGRLLLVNRVLDGDFANTSGLDLIAEATTHGARAILVSNFEDAQETARSRGAMEGFGKSAINDPRTTEVLQAAHRR